MAAPTDDLYRDALFTAHEFIHKGDVDKAHEIIHQAILGEAKGIKPMDMNEHQFDLDFREICIKNGIEACYARFIEDGIKRPDRKVGMSIRTGGNMRPLSILELMLKAAPKEIK